MINFSYTLLAMYFVATCHALYTDDHSIIQLVLGIMVLMTPFVNKLHKVKDKL